MPMAVCLLSAIIPISQTACSRPLPQLLNVTNRLGEESEKETKDPREKGKDWAQERGEGPEEGEVPQKEGGSAQQRQEL